MASIVAKKKANKLYYYVVESARVHGNPRIVHQTYLGTADKVAALVKDRTAPIPLSATALDFGLSGSLWLAAQQSGLWDVLTALWPAPRSGPSTAHYLFLAAVHRICTRGGVSIYPLDSKTHAQGGKLRLLYEANPMALLVEQAGGAASTGRERMLDVQPTQLHQRVPVFLGSKLEVEHVVAIHKQHDAA